MGAKACAAGVPQTALMPVVTRCYGSGLLNFAAHSPDIASATENAVLRAAAPAGSAGASGA